MTEHDSYFDDKYEHYEAQFNSTYSDRKARRSRKTKVKHVPKKSANEVLAESADTIGLESGFKTTYQPSRYEEGWLIESLSAFYDQSLITDVLAVVRGGKEATVYRCAAHPVTGEELLVAKVYRPRMFRQLRNDAMYREGRRILTASGQAVKETDHRVMRALGKKTAFGAQVAHTSWLMHEYTTLQRLYSAGVAVPKPITSGENAILMGYFGDEQIAAPTLSQVRLDADEAEPLFKEVLHNVELMLRQDIIHGDLSAYNILYWEGEIALIDFPQVVSSRNNRSALSILQRDVERVCEYFEKYGIPNNSAAITHGLWERYSRAIPDDPEEE